jgi:hypothetical protein
MLPLVAAADSVPQTVCPSLEEATHPRCYGEGYPDWPGRASNKEGESWTSISGLSSESMRRSSPHCPATRAYARAAVGVRNI